MFYNNGKAFHLEESKCVDLSYFFFVAILKSKRQAELKVIPETTSSESFLVL